MKNVATAARLRSAPLPCVVVNVVNVNVVTVIVVTVLVLAFASWSPAATFKRGDANADGQVDISDAVKALNVLFLGEVAEPCADASDSNNDGGVDISDPIYLLNFLFTGGAIIPPPYPGCGEDLDLVADGIGCDAYPHCVECFDDEDLNAIIAEQVEDSYCIAAGETVVSVPSLSLTVSVCPVEKAVPCGDPAAPGCTVALSTVDGTLDIPARQVRIRIEGAATALPVDITNTTFQTTTNCSTNITFAGDAVVPFTSSSNQDGTLTVVDLGAPSIENPDVSLEASGGLVCDLFALQQDLFVEELIRQLEEQAVGIVDSLRPEVVGKVICPGP